MLSQNTGSLHVTNKQTVTQQGVCLGNISNTYVGAQTWRRAEGFLMNEWLTRGAWEKQSTYSHRRTPFSSADRKSLLPNFFFVTAWGKKKRGKKVIQKKQKKQNITEQSGLDEERRREVRGGVVLYVWNRVESLEKKGRMLRTVAEEVRGISSRVPTLSLRGESRAQFFRYSSGAHKYLMSSHFNAKSCW